MHSLFSQHFFANQALLTGLLTALTLYLSGCGGEQTTSQEKSRKPSHGHPLREATQFDADAAIPSVDFTIKTDSVRGWNIHLHTDNFRFSPEKINANVASNEGHAHLYIDGFKMARLYGPWYHLNPLTPGEHTIRIVLNANDHSEWAHEGQAIAKSIVIHQQ